jgi:hypothetical protein
MVAKWTGASTLGNSMIYDNGSRVGIGTTSPSIAGLEIMGTGSYGAGIELRHGTDRWGITNDDNGLLFVKMDGATFTPMRIEHPSGYIGIGTATPTTTLDVRSSNAQAVRFESTSNIMYMSIYEGGSYRGYLGSYSGAAEDVDFGTGGSNATGKVHLVLAASPAVTIAPGGFVGIGTTTPNDALDISGDLDVAGEIRLGSVERFTDGGANTIAVNSNIDHETDNLDGLGTSAKRWVDVWAVDGTINTSDAREKTDIEDLPYGLDEVMAMRPVTYKWIHNPERGTKIGLLAQDLQTIVPEVVRDWERKTNEETGAREIVPSQRLGVMYDDIIPVTIKAIQEQQVKIEAQQAEIEMLKAEMEVLKQMLRD